MRTPEDQALINGQDRLIEELEKSIDALIKRRNELEKQIESVKAAIRWLINS